MLVLLPLMLLLWWFSPGLMFRRTRALTYVLEWLGRAGFFNSFLHFWVSFSMVIFALVLVTFLAFNL
jgi:hypothetical protein